jgi:amidohydrolase
MGQGHRISRSDIDRVVAEIMPTVIDVRRAIHMHPELAHEEFKTTELLVNRLRSANLAPRARTPRTGLTVDIGTDGPIVAFRCDIDALPISEPEGVAFTSRVPGIMHACGHDAHAAIGFGVAVAISRLELPGRVRVLFQPAEEAFPGGAYELLKDGVMDGVESILAFHVDPGVRTGLLGFRPGPITSSADRFFITLEGPGGHTARPHKTVDLIGAAGQVITQLPALLERKIDARSPLVMVFGKVHGGSADNVIPTMVELSGTVRTADRELWESVPTLIDKLVGEIIAPFGSSGIVHYQRGLPPVMNDPGVTAIVSAATSALMGPRAVTDTHVSMGAEDFARYVELAPGTLVRLGCAENDASTDLHSASFRLDERALEIGIKTALAGLDALLRSA